MTFFLGKCYRFKFIIANTTERNEKVAARASMLNLCRIYDAKAYFLQISK